MSLCPPRIDSDAQEELLNRVWRAIVLQTVVVVGGLFVVTLFFINPPPWGVPIPIPVGMLASIAIGASVGAWAGLFSYRKMCCIVFVASVIVGISTTSLCYAVSPEAESTHCISLVGTSPYVQFMFACIVFCTAQVLTASLSGAVTAFAANLLRGPLTISGGFRGR